MRARTQADVGLRVRPFGSLTRVGRAIVRSVKAEWKTPSSDAEEPPSVGQESLIGVGAWPDAVTSYLLSASEPSASEPSASGPDARDSSAPEGLLTLAVTLSTQGGHWLPGRAGLAGITAPQAAAQAERYQLIRSQLDSPGLSVWLQSTLNSGLALPVLDGAPSLRRHAAAAELFAAAAATATPPKLTGITTLGQLLDCYGLLPQHLAPANAELPLSSLLAAGQTLAASADQTGPAETPAGTATLAEVAGRLSSTPERLLQDNRGLRLAAEPAFALPGVAALPEAARTPYQVRAGDTLATLARRFASTPRAIVADNATRSAALPPGIQVEAPVEAPDEAPDEAAADEAPDEVAAASTVTIEGDSFEAVRARLAAQNADITLDAVADALDRLGAPLAAGTVLSCPLAVLGSGQDSDLDQGGDSGVDGAAALTAAQIQAEYGCSPASFAAANAAVLGVLQPGVQLSLSGGATVTTAQHDTLNAVLGRFAEAGLTPSIAQLMADNASASLFRSGARALLPPPPVVLSASGQVAGTTAAPAFELAVTLRLERPAASEVPAASSAPVAEPGATPTLERADTVVPPHEPGLDGAGFDAFIDACLLALPTIRLATDAGNQLWAVSFGSQGISSVRIEAPLPDAAAPEARGPRVFALRPLYPDLIDFSAEIRPVTELGSLGVPVLQRFHQVDVESWARSLLTDLDRYLCQPLSARVPDAAGAELSGIRRRLAAAVAGGLTPLTPGEPESPAADPGLLSARAALTGIGRSSLASAYATVTAQHRAVVVSPYGRDGLPAAWLHGTVAAPGRADLELSRSRTGLGPSEGWCVFALTSADATGASTTSVRPDHVFDAFELDSPGLGGSGAEPVLLRFLRPLTGGYHPEAAVSALLPPVDVPVPLRAHPSPPSLRAMTATPTFSGPGQPTLDAATQWTAGLCYTHEHAAQDVVRVSVPHAPPAPGAGTAVGGSTAVGGTALAEALAAYTAAACDLAALIGAGVQPAVAAVEVLRGNAAASLVELAAAVAAAWTGHGTGYPVSAEPASAEPTDCCLLRAVYATDLDGRRLLDRLVVRRDGVEDGWPVITLVDGDEQAPLTPGPVTAGSREYTAADRPAAPGPMTLRLEWPGVRAAPRPDARVSVRVERNAELRAGTVTSPALVLRSPVSQLDVARPSLRWTEQLPLTGVDVAQALQNGFDALFGEQPDGYRVSIEVSYAAPIQASAPAGEAGGSTLVLPVLMAPELLLAPDSATTLAATLEAWRQENQPAAAGAQWRVRLALLSTPGEPPLLAFDQLVYDIPG